MKKLVAVLLVLFMLFGFAQAEETAEELPLKDTKESGIDDPKV